MYPTQDKQHDITRYLITVKGTVRTRALSDERDKRQKNSDGQGHSYRCVNLCDGIFRLPGVLTTNHQVFVLCFRSRGLSRKVLL
jgi:hypothetical protein